MSMSGCEMSGKVEMSMRRGEAPFGVAMVGGDLEMGEMDQGDC